MNSSTFSFISRLFSSSARFISFLILSLCWVESSASTCFFVSRSFLHFSSCSFNYSLSAAEIWRALPYFSVSSPFKARSPLSLLNIAFCVSSFEDTAFFAFISLYYFKNSFFLSRRFWTVSKSSICVWIYSSSAVGTALLSSVIKATVLSLSLCFVRILRKSLWSAGSQPQLKTPPNFWI